MSVDRSEYFRAWRKAHPEYAIKRRESGRTAEACRKYRADHPGEHYKRIKTYRAANPDKWKAHSLINWYVKTGKLERLACEKCGNPKSHAHHADYSKPLEVNWLCALCHKQAHKTI